MKDTLKLRWELMPGEERGKGVCGPAFHMFENLVGLHNAPACTHHASAASSKNLCPHLGDLSQAGEQGLLLLLGLVCKH